MVLSSSLFFPWFRLSGPELLFSPIGAAIVRSIPVRVNVKQLATLIRYVPNETWYRDKETGQIYSLHPFDDRPGLWMEVDPNDLIEPGQKVQ